ncbi:MAG: hypothetical protein IT376_15330 [Polyangiaceae bacterium]|nr:hypothetical protein [Polyangiaceae bacterium]
MTRPNRLARVQELRARQLDAAARNLASAKEREAEAGAAAARARLDAARATAARRGLPAEAVAVHSNHDEWAQDRARESQRALTHMNAARVASRQAHGKLVEARASLRALELLGERRAAEARRDEERRARREEDDRSPLSGRRRP